MQITSGNRSASHTTLAGEPALQVKAPLESPVLSKVSKIEASTQTMTTQEELKGLSGMMRRGMNTILERLKTSGPVEEKIPDYIASGREIRLAAEALEQACLNAPHDMQPDQFECELLSLMANSTQQLLQTELEHSLPKSMDNDLRWKIVNNLYSEQFLQNTTALLP
ncbi:hypothetical protein [Vagococcus sp. WN89Y]|uniref:hypothetical protein n=1 Tax=Vagococcus sp. WN89Y TaxID=3457258 RepID=UPI003FCCFE3A